jgi:hypothetical protein
MKRIRPALSVAFSTGLVGVFTPTFAWAQAGPTPPPAGTGQAPPAGGTATPAQPTQPTQGVGGGFGFGNPQSPNGTIGGGNATESSAHPVTGDQEDSFDLGPKSGDNNGGAVHGDENGPVFLGGPTFAGGETPYSHIVHRGDTLWGICGYYFQNSYQWPRIWSYNPQIRNPNWIYPGDEIRLKSGTEERTAAKPALPYQGPGMTLVDRRRQVPRGTVFLRDQGWIRDSSDEVWGDITGANADKMFLSDGDEVYIHIDRGHEVRLGQELTIFHPLHMAAAGTIVQIGGTARIDSWDAQDRVARARIVESLNVIERGAKVGPLDRTFNVVPPRRNEVDVEARVLASLHPHEFFGQNQVVFIDKGEDAGLKVGNRLFVMRRGDPWRNSLVRPHAGDRVSPDDETPMPPMEQVPGSRHDEGNYPEEVVAELRIITLKKDSATCLMTASRSEVEPYDRVVARKGY